MANKSVMFLGFLLLCCVVSMCGVSIMYGTKSYNNQLPGDGGAPEGPKFILEDGDYVLRSADQDLQRSYRLMQLRKLSNVVYSFKIVGEADASGNFSPMAPKVQILAVQGNRLVPSMGNDNEYFVVTGKNVLTSSPAIQPTLTASKINRPSLALGKYVIRDAKWGIEINFLLSAADEGKLVMSEVSDLPDRKSLDFVYNMITNTYNHENRPIHILSDGSISITSPDGAQSLTFVHVQ